MSVNRETLKDGFIHPLVSDVYERVRPLVCPVN